MFALRWEILRPVEPWAAPQASLLGFPVASGTIARDEGGAEAQVYAPAEPITVPSALEGERHLIVALEAFGGRAWYVLIGTDSQPPAECDGLLHAVDPHAGIYVPSGGMTGTGRSREVRAVRPGSIIIARPGRP